MSLIGICSILSKAPLKAKRSGRLPKALRKTVIRMLPKYTLSLLAISTGNTMPARVPKVVGRCGLDSSAVQINTIPATVCPLPYFRCRATPGCPGVACFPSCLRQAFSVWRRAKQKRSEGPKSQSAFHCPRSAINRVISCSLMPTMAGPRSLESSASMTGSL